MSKHKLEIPRTVLWQRNPPGQPSTIDDDDVEPGERKRKKQYRKKTVGDLLVPLATSTVFAAGTAGIVYAMEAGSKGALLSGSITLLVIFAVTGLPVVFKNGPSVLELAETITRIDLNGDHTIGVAPREVVHAYHVVAELRDGISSIYADLGIVSEEQATAWHEFCRSVRDGRRRFTGNEAEDAGIDRTWFAEVLVPRWSPREDPKRQLIDPDSVGPRQTLVLLDSGKRMVRAFARVPPTPHG